MRGIKQKLIVQINWMPKIRPRSLNGTRFIMRSFPFHRMHASLHQKSLKKNVQTYWKRPVQEHAKVTTELTQITLLMLSCENVFMRSKISYRVHFLCLILISKGKHDKHCVVYMHTFVLFLNLSLSLGGIILFSPETWQIECLLFSPAKSFAPAWSSSFILLLMLYLLFHYFFTKVHPIKPVSRTCAKLARLHKA